MIIHDEETLEQAIDMLEQGPLRYMDRYAWITVTNEATLVKQAGAALRRNEIALVAPKGQEILENYDAALRDVRRERAKRERQAVREWIKAHPVEAQNIMKTVRESLESK